MNTKLGLAMLLAGSLAVAIHIPVAAAADLTGAAAWVFAIALGCAVGALVGWFR